MNFKSQIKKMSLRQLQILKNRIWYLEFPAGEDKRYKFINLINKRISKLELKKVNTIVEEIIEEEE